MTGVYAVYDVVALCMVGPLMVVPSDAAARRVFQDALTSQGSTLTSHPEDYCLFKVALLDIETGTIIGSDKPFLQVEPVITGDMVLEQLRRRSSNSARQLRPRSSDSALPEAAAQESTDGDDGDVVRNHIQEVLSGS